MLRETPRFFGNDDDPLTWMFWTCATRWQEGGGSNGADRAGICPVEKLQKMAKVDHYSWETWLEINNKTVTNVNQRLKVPLYVETQKIQEIHLIHTWIAESRTKKHLYCTRGAENFDLCLICPNWTKLLPYGFFALCLLRLDFTL